MVWSFDDNQPRFRHQKWRSVFDDQTESNPLSLTTSANPLFALPIGEHVQEWEVWLTKEAVWDRFNTLSQIAILEGEEREVSLSIFLGGPTAFCPDGSHVKLSLCLKALIHMGQGIRYVCLYTLLILTNLSQRVYKIYTDAVNASDVETNDKGEIALHGQTVTIWTTKIPSEGARALVTDVIDAVKDKLS